MKNKKKFILLFLFVILIIVVIVGYLVVNHFVQENTLKAEINQLAKLDVTKDRYNRKIKTTGNYAVVEDKIKSYLDEYAVSLQNILSLLKDEKLLSLLSADNYKSDGPEFSKSIAYVESAKKNFNDDINKLIDYCSEKNITEYISDQHLNKYYVNLYKELMLDNDISKDLDSSKSLLEESKVKMNNLFDISLEVFKFLKANQDKWKIDNDQILFETDELVNQYNNLIQKIK